MICTNQPPPQRGGAVPDLFWVGSKWLLAFPRVPVTPGTPLHFLLCFPVNDRRRAAHSFFKIGRLFSLSPFFCPSLGRLCLLILLLLLMSGNVRPNPGPIFPCSVCAGNVTWQGKSVQCCTCSIWVHLRCSQLSLSKFRALDSCHSWSCQHCRNTVTFSLDSSVMYNSTAQSGHPSANAALPPHPVSKPLIPVDPFCIFSLCPHHRPLLMAVFLRFFPPLPPDSLKILQSNTAGLRARSTELLHFLSSHPVDLICIQESNLNPSSSFRIPGFSALRSDLTHSRSGILSPDATHVSGCVIIFVRQGLSFSELSTSSLSSIDPYSDYVEVNIFLNNSSSLSFLKVYAPLFAPLQRMAEFFSPNILFSSRNLFHFARLQLPSPPLGLKRYFRQPRGKCIQQGHILALNNSDTPIFLHRSIRGCSSPDILFSCLFLLPLPSTFRKLAGMTLPFTLTLTVLLLRNTRLFLFPLLLLSLPLWH